MTEKKFFGSSKSSMGRGLSNGFGQRPHNDRFNNNTNRNNENNNVNGFNRRGDAGFNNNRSNNSFGRNERNFNNNRYSGNGNFNNNRGDNFSKSNGYRFVLSEPPQDLPVIKNFYNETPETKNRPHYEIQQWHYANNVTFRGIRVPNPILTFNEITGLPDGVMHCIKKQGFETPTVIQSQAWPLALSGRDLVGIAQTGSGKTLAYALPALVHVEGNMPRRRYGPSVLVLAPTRELAQQIKDVVNIFRTRAVCIFGGASKFGQRKEYDRNQPSIIIACPGRLIDFVEEGTIKLHNISYLVLDEADRMLDMGFEPQIRKIVDKIPKNRQTLMWSATWPKEVRKLAEDFLVDYVQINIGSVQLAANHNITQIIDICDEHEKTTKLYKLLTQINANNRENKTIIFAETKRKVDQLSMQMRSAGWVVSAIHGDKAQTERDWALNEFKTGRNPILIATDVAARGLDVDDIKYVINYDYPNCSEDYVHRIGRTGRRDRKGTSYTFFTINNAKQASDLIDVLKEANQEVPERLYEFSNQSHRFGKNVRKRYGNYGGGGGSGYSRFGEKRFSNFGGMKRKFDGDGGGSYNAGKGNNRFKKPNYGNGTHSANGNHYDRFNNYS